MAVRASGRQEFSGVGAPACGCPPDGGGARMVSRPLPPFWACGRPGVSHGLRRWRWCCRPCPSRGGRRLTASAVGPSFSRDGMAVLQTAPSWSKVASADGVRAHHGGGGDPGLKAASITSSAQGGGGDGVADRAVAEGGGRRRVRWHPPMGVVLLPVCHFALTSLQRRRAAPKAEIPQ
jgi:hypothetical protein